MGTDLSKKYNLESEAEPVYNKLSERECSSRERVVEVRSLLPSPESLCTEEELDLFESRKETKAFDCLGKSIEKEFHDSDAQNRSSTDCSGKLHQFEEFYDSDAQNRSSTDCSRGKHDEAVLRDFKNRLSVNDLPCRDAGGKMPEALRPEIIVQSPGNRIHKEKFHDPEYLKKQNISTSTYNEENVSFVDPHNQSGTVNASLNLRRANPLDLSEFDGPISDYSVQMTSSASLCVKETPKNCELMINPLLHESTTFGDLDMKGIPESNKQTLTSGDRGTMSFCNLNVTETAKNNKFRRIHDDNKKPDLEMLCYEEKHDLKNRTDEMRASEILSELFAIENCKAKVEAEKDTPIESKGAHIGIKNFETGSKPRQSDFARKSSQSNECEQQETHQMRFSNSMHENKQQNYHPGRFFGQTENNSECFEENFEPRNLKRKSGSNFRNRHLVKTASSTKDEKFLPKSSYELFCIKGDSKRKKIQVSPRWRLEDTGMRLNYESGKIVITTKTSPTGSFFTSKNEEWLRKHEQMEYNSKEDYESEYRKITPNENVRASKRSLKTVNENKERNLKQNQKSLECDFSPRLNPRYSTSKEGFGFEENQTMFERDFSAIPRPGTPKANGDVDFDESSCKNEIFDKSGTSKENVNVYSIQSPKSYKSEVSPKSGTSKENVNVYSIQSPKSYKSEVSPKSGTSKENGAVSSDRSPKSRKKRVSFKSSLDDASKANNVVDIDRTQKSLENNFSSIQSPKALEHSRTTNNTQSKKRFTLPSPESLCTDDEPDLKPKSLKRGRTVIAGRQLDALTSIFHRNPFPNAMMREEIAYSLGIKPRTVQIWFQNQRQKTKTVLKDGGMYYGQLCMYRSSKNGEFAMLDLLSDAADLAYHESDVVERLSKLKK